MLSGCPKPTAEKISQPVSTRSDVPIKIAYFGTNEEGEAIKRAWGAIDEQPIEIAAFSMNHSDTSGGFEPLIEATRKSDLVIFPLMATAELRAAEVVVPISDEHFGAMEIELGEFYSAARNGAARYATEYVAIPLGARLPAILSTHAAPSLKSWKDYNEWISKDLKGKGAEPLASGWAGIMFLWRAASSIDQGWLFSRDNFQPIIHSAPYEETLEQMLEVSKFYREKSMSPDDIFRAIQKGELDGGIGFGSSDESNEVDVNFNPLPGIENRNRIAFDPFSPMIAMSAMCRQSAISKRFMNWLAGGEGTQGVRRQVPSFTLTRAVINADITTNASRKTAYETWLAERLKTPVTLPSFQIFAADEYYASLDEAVLGTIDGKYKPSEALERVAQKWQSITERIGPEKQLSAWRRAQGMRA